jgi:hypothetical protein
MAHHNHDHDQDHNPSAHNNQENHNDHNALNSLYSSTFASCRLLEPHNRFIEECM